jgi:L-iditol 2-dehydrogenase
MSDFWEVVMERVSLKANGELHYETVGDCALESKQVALKIRAAGVCSSDIYRAFDSWAYHYPLTMGHELCGQIIGLGSDVSTEYNIGDMVTVFPLIPCGSCVQCHQQEFARCGDYSYYGSRVNGGFSTRLNVNEWNLVRLPENVSIEDACLTEPCAVVLHGISRLKITNPDSKSIALIGGGFLGLIAVEMLRFNFPNLSIHIFDRNKTKLSLANKLAAITHLVDTEEQWKLAADRLSDKFDYVIENTGHPNRFRDSINLSKPGGRVLWLGNITKDLHLEKELVSAILRKELTINGSWNSHFKADLVDDWASTLKLMANGFRPSKFISHKIKLDELPEILSRMYLHKVRKDEFNYVKVIVKDT